MFYMGPISWFTWSLRITCNSTAWLALYFRVQAPAVWPKSWFLTSGRVRGRFFLRVSPDICNVLLSLLRRGTFNPKFLGDCSVLGLVLVVGFNPNL